MGRNCVTKDQARALIAELRASVGRDDAPILIDQEGGRVARLKPPHWPKFPPAASLGMLYARDHALGLDMARIAGSLIGDELRQIGVTVNCAPVLDIAHPETHQAIGDRAFATDPEAVAALGQAYADGLLSQGVLPVIKHMPGHGRAVVDPHVELPTVYQSRAELAPDFEPFRRLRHLPVGMSSHILFPAIDPVLPASQSPAIVRDIIRGEIGFDGLLITDDLDMGALGGALSDRARLALAAGSDVALICNSKVADMHDLAAGLPPMTEQAWSRWEKAKRAIHQPERPLLAQELYRRLEAALA